MACFKEYDRTVLARDLPAHGLKAGDIGTVVLVHGAGAGYEVEFCAMTGQTVAVVTVNAGEVRPAAEGEIAHVRALAG